MSADTLQALTAAVSPSGLTTYLRHFVNTTYAAHLNGQAAPDDMFFADTLVLGPVTILRGYRTVLRGGRIAGAQAQFNSVTSQGGGTFTVVLTAAADVAYQTWEETGYEGMIRPEPFGNRLSNFTFSISKLQLTFKVTVAASGGQWNFTIVEVSQSSFDVSSVNIPQGSRLLSGGEDWLNRLFGCVSNAVADRIRDHLRSESFTDAAKAALRADLQTIANSGQLTPGITYEYHPRTMSFPDGGGLAFGANGAVTFKDKGGTVTAYPGAIPPPLALPAVDPARHVNFYVHQYDFDALLWGFFKNGDLSMRVTKRMLVDGAPLETDTYRDSPLHALYERYPGHDLTMAITALVAPTVVFNQIDMITDDALKEIAATKQVPQAVLDKLGEMVNIVLPDQAAFLDKLSQYIGADNVRLYKDVILKYSVAMAAVVTYEFQYDMNVVDKGQDVRVMRIKVDEYDFLENLVLASKGATQTVTFQFKAGTTAAVTLIETTVPGVQPCDPKNLSGCVFTQIWRQTLKPRVSAVLASVGKTGVPLPFIQGFLFVEDVVTLQPTYARIDTNMKFA